MEARHPKIKPILHQKLLINGRHNYRLFSKNNTKYFKAIEYENLVVYTRKDNRRELSRTHKMLLKLGRNSKVLNALMLKIITLRFDFTRPEIWEVIKGFRRIKELSLPCADSVSKVFWDDIIWVRHCKRISTLYCRSQCPSKFKMDPQAKVDYACDRFFKELRRAKVVRGATNHYINLTQVPFHNYPKHLKKYSFYPPIFVPSSKAEEKDMMGDFARWTKLESLEIHLPTDLSTLSTLLESIPNPSKVTSLVLFVRNSDSENVEEIKRFQKCLLAFDRLVKLNLQFVFEHHCLDMLSFLQSDASRLWRKLPFVKKIFATPNSFQLSKLRDLTLRTPIENSTQISSLAKLIEQCVFLNKLSFGLLGEFSHCLNPEYIKFFEKVSILKSLQSLEIEAAVRNPNSADNQHKGVLQGICKWLTKLNDLKELKLIFKMMHFSDGFSELNHVLKKKAPGFKKFELYFDCERLSPENSIQFLEFLAGLKMVEEMSLNGLSFRIPNFWKNFFAIAASLPKLRCFKISDFDNYENAASYLDQLLHLLSKKGFEGIDWECRGVCNDYSDYPPINLRRIFGKNPSLRKIILPNNLAKFFPCEINKLPEKRWRCEGRPE